jgi:glycosyltransferase involved in cell wall biosynthesis
VITTDHSGIRDVFRDAVNGLQVEPRSPASLARALERLAAAPEALLPIALANRALATARYRTATYNMALERILESVGSHAQR